LADTIYKGSEPVLLSYKGGTFTSLDGAFAASYANRSVTNGSTVVSISYEELNHQTLLFPSPTNGNINFRSPVYIQSLVIVDLLGQTVHIEDVNAYDGEIEIKDLLNPGIYIMKLYANEKVMVKRFVKR
jgi:hypothetical protein